MHKVRFTLTRAWDPLYRNRWLILSIVVLSIALAAIRAHGGQSETLEENHDPHLNAHCSPRGSPNSVACDCLSMVGEVQRQLAARCWADAGFPGPPPHIPGFDPPVPPPAVMDCLGRVADHCEIIAKVDPWAYWTIVIPEWVKQWVQTKKWPLNNCATRCYRTRCNCQDQRCAAEGHNQ
jgi:hypothetical protein